MKYVLDTVIFNRVLDGKFSLSSLPEGSAFVATRIQLEELKKTPDLARRCDLLRTFHEIAPELIPASFSFDIKGAGFDEGKWSESDDSIKLRSDLGKIKPKPNNWEDALIAEVALEQKYWLVTADKNLANVARKHGVSVYSVD